MTVLIILIVALQDLTLTPPSKIFDARRSAVSNRRPRFQPDSNLSPVETGRALTFRRLDGAAVLDSFPFLRGQSINVFS
ncbi:MAG: hypothetical protein ABWZ17_00325, partial [Candidatus Binatia bacterium]